VSPENEFLGNMARFYRLDRLETEEELNGYWEKQTANRGETVEGGEK
jgi:hypothetical protein